MSGKRAVLLLVLAMVLLPAAAHDQAPLSPQAVGRGKQMQRFIDAFKISQTELSVMMRDVPSLTQPRISRVFLGRDTFSLAERRRVFKEFDNILADSVSNDAGNWMYSAWSDSRRHR